MVAQTGETQAPTDMNETWILTLGQVIRELRVERRLSQGMLARKVTISQAAMSNYESGKRQMATGLFLSLARALEHEPQVLFERVSREAESVARSRWRRGGRQTSNLPGASKQRRAGRRS